MIKAELHSNAVKIDIKTINLSQLLENYKVFLEIKGITRNFDGYYERIILYSDSMYVYLPYKFKDYLYTINQNDGIINIKHKEIDNSDILYELKPDFKPRDWQIKAKDIILNRKLNRGIIKIPTGAGKTYFMIYLMHFLNTNYIVVVDDKNILNQWVNSILNIYSNITKDDLLIINSQYDKSKIENDIKHKKIIITTVQSLLSFFKRNPSYYIDLFKNSKFNAVVYDEAHLTSSADLYSKSLILFEDFKYIFGLTATPKITTFPIHILSIGDVIIDANDVGYVNDYKYNSIINIVKIKFKEGLTLPPYINYLERGGSLDYSSYSKISTIYNSAFEDVDGLYKLIIKTLLKDLNDGRKILISVNKIETVERIYKILNTNIDKIVEKLNREILFKKLTSNEKNRDLTSKTFDVVISTYKISAKGLDIPYIDTLYLTKFISGNTSLTQLFGRIFRIYDNKKPPKINLFVEYNYFNRYVKEDKFKNTIMKIFDNRLNEKNIKKFEVILWKIDIWK